ncbi:hypothetical protein EJ997_08100 [Flaviflexus ciconiae]|uniref:Uncharacterized protein n=1 Tax=Flaviflexus ciconiae TaxID=2496867 RepID=A0A3S9PY85_9ACTO|nr:hypothetical protein [Flaviflexus ciconiae]AZQ77298.1 hypothetical protein EJ997_08100 [Flaviflexus ciconiae]
MKRTALAIFPIILLGAAACGEGEQKSAEVTITTSQFVGWETVETTEEATETYQVTEGSEIKIDRSLTDMTITVEEINEDSIEVSFSSAMAAGTSGGGSDTIFGTIIRDGQGVDISSPSDDQVDIFFIEVDIYD